MEEVAWDRGRIIFSRRKIRSLDSCQGGKLCCPPWRDAVHRFVSVSTRSVERSWNVSIADG